MKTYTVLMSKNNFDASKVSIGNLVYIYDSENLNHTLGFVTMQHEVCWIPLMKDTAPSSTGNSSSIIVSSLNPVSSKGDNNVDDGVTAIQKATEEGVSKIKETTSEALKQIQNNTTGDSKTITHTFSTSGKICFTKKSNSSIS
jgi:hypothetical protein